MGGGREGGKGQRWDVLLKGGLGVLSQEKKLKFRFSEIDSDAIWGAKITWAGSELSLEITHDARTRKIRAGSDLRTGTLASYRGLWVQGGSPLLVSLKRPKTDLHMHVTRTVIWMACAIAYFISQYCIIGNVKMPREGKEIPRGGECPPPPPQMKPCVYYCHHEFSGVIKKRPRRCDDCQ